MRCGMKARNQVAIELDRGQPAELAQERQRERAFAGPDLDDVIAGMRRDRLHDAAQDAGIVQEMLAEAFARDVLHGGTVMDRVAATRALRESVESFAAR